MRAKLLSIDSADEFDGVWPENVATVEAFLVCGTQWRAAAGVERLVFLGLDYAGAKVAIEAAGMTLDPKLFNGLRAMEIAARDALNQAGAV